jgi:hypothetical protein
MTTVSPAAANRTYSLSLFFKIFSPILRIHSSSFQKLLCQAGGGYETDNLSLSYQIAFDASAASLQQNLS